MMNFSNPYSRGTRFPMAFTSFRCRHRRLNCNCDTFSWKTRGDVQRTCKLLTNLVLLNDLRQCHAIASQSAECDSMVGYRSFFSDHSLVALFFVFFKPGDCFVLCLPGNCLVLFTAGSCLVLLILRSKRYISTISSSGSSSSASSRSSSALW